MHGCFGYGGKMSCSTVLPILYKILSNLKNNEAGWKILDPVAVIRGETTLQLWADILSLTLMSAPDRSSLARMRSSRVTSSATVMRLVWIWKILLLVFSSGRGNSILRSILPEKKTETSYTAAVKSFFLFWQFQMFMTFYSADKCP